MMQRFTIPREVYTSDNAIEVLKTLQGKKAFIVIGSERTIKDGTVEKVQNLLKEASMESMVFQGVEHDPSYTTVKKGTEALREFGADWIIGIGGGSPIDAAKSMWIFYEHPELAFAEAFVPFSLPKLRNKAKFIGITTTSGTATEVTSFSVVTNPETGIKYPIADYEITPDITIVDTNLVMSLTPELVAYTGMDALTHALEAYVSNAATPITDALAVKSIEMIDESLVDSFKGNETARKAMHISQCLAGMSFSNAILGIVHSMAHKTGKLFNIPHGCANAIYLPYVIQYNAKEAPKKYADIARRLGLAGNDQMELVNALVAYVKNMKKEMHVPASVKEFGISYDAFTEKLDFFAEEAVNDPCTGTNPRTIDTETMKKLYLCAYHGEDVQF